MSDRKTLKVLAKKHLKRHYALLVILCSISAFLGTEFTSVIVNAQLWFHTLTGQTEVVENLSPRISKLSDSQFISDIINNYINSDLDVDALKEEAAAKKQALADTPSSNAILGRQQGVLAEIVNSVTSGEIVTTVIAAVYSIVRSKQIAGIFTILLSTSLMLSLWIFIRNVYKAILRRAILECRTYSVYPMSHLTYLLSVHRWIRASLTLLLQTLFTILWSLTIVGGVIKHYSYYLVPFIVAENPDIRPRDAITLSRRMMDGHKWECFLLDLSFIGWDLLGFVSFGLVHIFWGIPYRFSAFSEFYVALRQEAKTAAVPGTERLCDEALYAPVDAALLSSRYSDIIRLKDIASENIVELTPVRRFFAQNFGIWLITNDEKKIYSHQEALRHQMRTSQLEVNGLAYPERMSPLWDGQKTTLTGKINYLTPVTVWTLLFIFFFFSIVGWLYEVSLTLVMTGEFANRGMLHGPWLPIYGSGAILVTVLLYRFRRRPGIEVLAIILLCGVIEYMTSYVMECTQGLRWWDYTGYFLNLNGRICAEGLIVFALAGTVTVYVLLPLIDDFVSKIKPTILIPACLLLLLLFSIDFAYSHSHPNVGKGITGDAPPEIISSLPVESQNRLSRIGF